MLPPVSKRAIVPLPDHRRPKSMSQEAATSSQIGVLSND
jgi:hypothetical protein